MVTYLSATAILVALFFTISNSDNDGVVLESALAQPLTPAVIQITSTSTFIDDFGNFHIIGEINNTAIEPQTDILVSATLSNTSSNTSIGNYSAFSSLGTLRQGELSPFDIVIYDPQIIGKFNFIGFSTTSKPATIIKPANIVLNGSNVFTDNTGISHLLGNIINKGITSEEFLNLVVTFYDNSSLGIVSTQSFGLNVANLTSNQMVPFDLSITDNKTKSQAKFYSIDIDSSKSSMSYPLNTKFPFNTTLNNSTQFVTDSNISNPVLNGNQALSGFNGQIVGTTNNNNNNNDEDNDKDNNDNHNDNQRGEKLKDDNGNPVFNDRNCNEKPGSSGGRLSECEEAEKEERDDQDDEDGSGSSNGGSDTNDDESGDSGDNDGGSTDDNDGDNSNSGDNSNDNENDDNGSDDNQNTDNEDED